MAPVRMPLSLRHLSLAQVADLVRNTCSSIMSAHPDSQQDRLTAAVSVGDFLRSRAWPLLEEVSLFAFTEGVVVDRVHGCVIQPPRSSPLPRGEDYETSDNTATELMLAVFANPAMRTLHCRSERICSSYFHRLQGLMKLDLGCLVALPEATMEAITDNCQQLEMIAFNFRATSLHAIGQLKLIKSLRVIKDTCARCLFDRQKYHIDLLRTLVKELPRLEHVTCRCIGAVLDGLDQGQPLSLLDVREKNPGQELHSVARLCLRLERLTLGSYSKMGTLLRCSFTPLIESPIKLVYLLLSCFRFSPTIEDFFFNKGVYLKALFLRDCYDLNLENVKLIGRSCPFLEKLDICRYNGIFDDVPINHYTCTDTSEVIFENLVDFSCNGLGLLPLCLAHAKRIRSILVIWLHLSRTDETEVLHAFTNLIAINPLSELTSLGLYAIDIVMSSQLLQYFYDLPAIEVISISYLKFHPDINNLIQDLNRRIVRDNSSLQLECKFSFASDEEEYYDEEEYHYS